MRKEGGGGEGEGGGIKLQSVSRCVLPSSSLSVSLFLLLFLYPSHKQCFHPLSHFHSSPSSPFPSLSLFPHLQPCNHRNPNSLFIQSYTHTLTYILSHTHMHTNTHTPSFKPRHVPPLGEYQGHAQQHQ